MRLEAGGARVYIDVGRAIRSEGSTIDGSLVRIRDSGLNRMMGQRGRDGRLDARSQASSSRPRGRGSGRSHEAGCVMKESRRESAARIEPELRARAKGRSHFGCTGDPHFGLWPWVVGLCFRMRRRCKSKWLSASSGVIGGGGWRLLSRCC